MIITIDSYYVTITGSNKYDGRYIIDYSTGSGHCCVIISIHCGIVMKFLNGDNCHTSEELIDWQNTFLKESQKIGAISGFDNLSGRPLVPEIYYINESAEIHYSNPCVSYCSPILLREYIPGICFNNYEERFPERFFSDLCGSLRLINRLDFFHMDLSKDNIIVGSDGRVWLIDFTGAFLYHNGEFICKNYKIFHLYCSELCELNMENFSAHKCEVFQAKMLLDIFNDYCSSFIENDMVNERIKSIYQIVLKADDPLSALEKEMSAFRSEYCYLFSEKESLP